MNEYMSFSQATEISVVSMLIVFALLYAISLVLSCFKFIPKEKVIAKINTNKETGSKEIKNPEGVTFEELEKDGDMLVAAMVASMEASGENRINNFKIVSIREI